MSPSVLAEHAAKTCIIVVVLIVGFRVLGKREMSQLNVYDLAMLMAVSNGVQNAMTGGLGNLTAGLVTSSTVVISAWALTRILARRPELGRLVVGTPTLLVHDGQVLRDRMRRQRITDADLDEALRAHGLETPDAAAMVVLEVDGTLSVVPKGEAERDSPPRRPRRRRTRRGGRGVTATPRRSGDP